MSALSTVNNREMAPDLVEAGASYVVSYYMPGATSAGFGSPVIIHMRLRVYSHIYDTA
jgi:hypothetical protein